MRQGFKVRTSLQDFKFGTYGGESMRGLYESLHCEGAPGVMNCVEGLPFTGDVVAILWKGYRIPVLFSLAPLDGAEKDAAVRLEADETGFGSARTEESQKYKASGRWNGLFLAVMRLIGRGWCLSLLED